MASDFEGKVVLVTGGTRGIGKALALQLAEEGALLALNYMSRSNDAEQTVAEVEERGARAIAAMSPSQMPHGALSKRPVKHSGQSICLSPRPGSASQGRQMISAGNAGGPPWVLTWMVPST